MAIGSKLFKRYRKLIVISIVLMFLISTIPNVSAGGKKKKEKAEAPFDLDSTLKDVDETYKDYQALKNKIDNLEEELDELIEKAKACEISGLDLEPYENQLNKLESELEELLDRLKDLDKTEKKLKDAQKDNDKEIENKKDEIKETGEALDQKIKAFEKTLKDLEKAEKKNPGKIDKLMSELDKIIEKIEKLEDEIEDKKQRNKDTKKDEKKLKKLEDQFIKTAVKILILENETNEFRAKLENLLIDIYTLEDALERLYSELVALESLHENIEEALDILKEMKKGKKKLDKDLKSIAEKIKELEKIFKDKKKKRGGKKKESPEPLIETELVPLKLQGMSSTFGVIYIQVTDELNTKDPKEAAENCMLQLSMDGKTWYPVELDESPKDGFNFVYVATEPDKYSFRAAMANWYGNIGFDDTSEDFTGKEPLEKLDPDISVVNVSFTYWYNGYDITCVNQQQLLPQQNLANDVNPNAKSVSESISTPVSKTPYQRSLVTYQDGDDIIAVGYSETSNGISIPVRFLQGDSFPILESDILTSGNIQNHIFLAIPPYDDAPGIVLDTSLGIIETPNLGRNITVPGLTTTYFDSSMSFLYEDDSKFMDWDYEISMRSNVSYFEDSTRNDSQDQDSQGINETETEGELEIYINTDNETSENSFKAKMNKFSDKVKAKFKKWQAKTKLGKKLKAGIAKFAGKFKSTWSKFKSKAGGLLGKFRDKVKLSFKGLKGKWLKKGKGFWGKFKSKYSNFYKGINSTIKGLLSKMDINVTKKKGEDVKNFLGGLINKVKKKVEQVVNKIKGKFNKYKSGFGKDFSGLKSKFKKYYGYRKKFSKLGGLIKKDVEREIKLSKSISGTGISKSNSKITGSWKSLGLLVKTNDTDKDNQNESNDVNNSREKANDEILRVDSIRNPAITDEANNKVINYEMEDTFIDFVDTDAEETYKLTETIDIGNNLRPIDPVSIPLDTNSRSVEPSKTDDDFRYTIITYTLEENSYSDLLEEENLDGFYDSSAFDFELVDETYEALDWVSDEIQTFGNLAFVAFGRLGVRAVDLSDPVNPDVRVEGSFEQENEVKQTCFTEHIIPNETADETTIATVLLNPTDDVKVDNVTFPDERRRGSDNENSSDNDQQFFRNVNQSFLDNLTSELTLDMNYNYEYFQELENATGPEGSSDEELYEKGRSYVKTILGKGRSWLKKGISKGSGYVNKGRSWVNNRVDKGKSWANGLVNKAKGYVNKGKSWAKGMYVKGNDWVNGYVNKAKGYVNKGKSLIKGMYDKGKDWANNYIGKAKGWVNKSRSWVNDKMDYGKSWAFNNSNNSNERTSDTRAISEASKGRVDTMARDFDEQTLRTISRFKSDTKLTTGSHQFIAREYHRDGFDEERYINAANLKNDTDKTDKSQSYTHFQTYNSLGQIETETIFDHETEDESYGWWGHCNGWVSSSVLDREPIVSVPGYKPFLSGQINSIITLSTDFQPGFYVPHLRINSSKIDDPEPRDKILDNESNENSPLILKGSLSGRLSGNYQVDFTGELTVEEDFVYQASDSVKATLVKGGKVTAQVEQSKFKEATLNLNILANITIKGQVLKLKGTVGGKIDSDYKVDLEGSITVREDFEYKKGKVTATLKRGGSLSVKVEKNEFKWANLSGLRVQAEVEIGEKELELQGSINEGKYQSNSSFGYEPCMAFGYSMRVSSYTSWIDDFINGSGDDDDDDDDDNNAVSSPDGPGSAGSSTYSILRWHMEQFDIPTLDPKNDSNLIQTDMFSVENLLKVCIINNTPGEYYPDNDNTTPRMTKGDLIEYVFKSKADFSFSKKSAVPDNDSDDSDMTKEDLINQFNVSLKTGYLIGPVSMVNSLLGYSGGSVLGGSNTGGSNFMIDSFFDLYVDIDDNNSNSAITLTVLQRIELSNLSVRNLRKGEAGTERPSQQTQVKMNSGLSIITGADWGVGQSPFIVDSFFDVYVDLDTSQNLDDSGNVMGVEPSPFRFISSFSVFKNVVGSEPGGHVPYRDYSSYFIAESDSFHGNSGSGVWQSLQVQNTFSTNISKIRNSTGDNWGVGASPFIVDSFFDVFVDLDSADSDDDNDGCGDSFLEINMRSSFQINREYCEFHNTTNCNDPSHTVPDISLQMEMGILSDFGDGVGGRADSYGLHWSSIVNFDAWDYRNDPDRLFPSGPAKGAGNISVDVNSMFPSGPAKGACFESFFDVFIEAYTRSNINDAQNVMGVEPSPFRIVSSVDVSLELNGSVEGNINGDYEVSFDGSIELKNNVEKQFGESVKVGITSGARLQVNVKKNSFKGAELTGIVITASVNVSDVEFELEGKVNGSINENYDFSFNSSIDHNYEIELDVSMIGGMVAHTERKNSSNVDDDGKLDTRNNTKAAQINLSSIRFKSKSEIRVLFNPATLSFDKTVPWTEQADAGFDIPNVQFTTSGRLYSYAEIKTNDNNSNNNLRLNKWIRTDRTYTSYYDNSSVSTTGSSHYIGGMDSYSPENRSSDSLEFIMNMNWTTISSTSGSNISSIMWVGISSRYWNSISSGYWSSISSSSWSGISSGLWGGVSGSSWGGISSSSWDSVSSSESFEMVFKGEIGFLTDNSENSSTMTVAGFDVYHRLTRGTNSLTWGEGEDDDDDLGDPNGQFWVDSFFDITYEITPDYEYKIPDDKIIKINDSIRKAKVLLDALNRGQPKPVKEYKAWYEELYKSWHNVSDYTLEGNFTPEDYRNVLKFIVNKGISLIKPALDSASNALIGGLGSIPFAGGAISASVSASMTTRYQYSSSDFGRNYTRTNGSGNANPSSVEYNEILYLAVNLEGIGTQMSLMQSFSYSGIEMQKNDCTIAGDQYTTETCYADTFIIMNISSKLDLWSYLSRYNSSCTVTVERAQERADLNGTQDIDGYSTEISYSLVLNDTLFRLNDSSSTSFETVFKGEISYLSGNSENSSTITVAGFDLYHRLTRGTNSRTWGDGYDNDDGLGDPNSVFWVDSFFDITYEIPTESENDTVRTSIRQSISIHTSNYWSDEDVHPDFYWMAVKFKGYGESEDDLNDNDDPYMNYTRFRMVQRMNFSFLFGDNDSEIEMHADLMTKAELIEWGGSINDSEEAQTQRSGNSTGYKPPRNDHIINFDFELRIRLPRPTNKSYALWQFEGFMSEIITDYDSSNRSAHASYSATFHMVNGSSYHTIQSAWREYDNSRRFKIGLETVFSFGVTDSSTVFHFDNGSSYHTIFSKWSDTGPTSNFKLEIEGVDAGQFTSAEINIEQETIDYDEDETFWCRVSTFMASASSGNLSMPELDDEVEISLGRKFNTDDKPGLQDYSINFLLENLSAGEEPLYHIDTKYNYTGNASYYGNVSYTVKTNNNNSLNMTYVYLKVDTYEKTLDENGNTVEKLLFTDVIKVKYATINLDSRTGSANLKEVIEVVVERREY